MSQYIKPFRELNYKDVNIAGGKGASLGEMLNAKIPVPDGFVVLALAFDKFLEETDLGVEIEAVIKKVKFKEMDSVEDASEKIRDMIADTKFPKDLGREIITDYKKLKAKLVAVRSSATAEDSSVASWAGELESYLNVTDKNLLTSVKKCWSSLFTPRAIFYRFEKKLHDQKVSVAVVVQKMVQSEVSGIIFTVHPVTRDRKQMVIEAGYGLGEAIVGGKVTPDTYIINKSKVESQKSKAIIDKNISEQRMAIVRAGDKGTKEIVVPKANQEKQKISDKLILDLAKICLNIEKHYKKPQDIEWAYEKKKIYITQSRPITTL
jgi:pyruvate, water dikinase